MRTVFLALLLAAAAPPVAAHHSALHFGGSAPQLLEPEKAFRFSAQARDGAVEVSFAIADGYYMYRDKFRFAAEGNPQVRLAVAIYVVSPVIPVAAQMLAWAGLLVGSAMFLRALDPLPPHVSGWWRVWKGAGIVALVAGVALVVGALAGAATCCSRSPA